MRALFEIDTKDYDPKGPAFVRPSVRGIILRDGKVAMVRHSDKPPPRPRPQGPEYAGARGQGAGNSDAGRVFWHRVKRIRKNKQKRLPRGPFGLRGSRLLCSITAFMDLVNIVQQLSALAGCLAEIEKAGIPKLGPILLFFKQGDRYRVFKIGEILKIA